jgi:antitoxin component YwqK of YwqJK toxin-antitoxin module
MKLVITTIIFILIGNIAISQTKIVTHDSLLVESKIYLLKSTHLPFTGTALSWNKGKKVIETQYVNGKVDGVEILYFANGAIETQSNYKEGKYNGLMINYYSNGEKKSEELYKNDYKNGKSTYYYPFGGKEKEGVYENCIEIGVWTFWNETGQKIAEKEYKEGEVIYEKKFVTNQ